MMADLGIAEIRAEGRKMLAKYRNTDGDSTDEAKAKRWAERGGAVVDQALAR